MTSQRFATGKQLKWQNEVFEIQHLLSNQQANLENMTTGAVATASISKLVQELFDGNLTFIEEGKHIKKDTAPGSSRARYLDLSDYPEREANIARFRHAVITPLLDMPKRTRQNVKEHICQLIQARVLDRFIVADYTLSIASVYRWIRDYENSGRDVRALVPDFEDRGGKDSHRVGGEVNSIIDAVIREKYLSREKKTVDDVLHEVALRVSEENQTRAANEKLKRPHRSTIVRRIDQLDLKLVFAAKHGKRAADQQFAQYGEGVRATSPLERAEIDHTLLDVMVIDEQDNLPVGRPTLTDCMDTATRYPLGVYIGFEPPSYYAVMECLYDAIRPKESMKEKYGTAHEWLSYGVMSTLVTDNGKEFIGTGLANACLSLNTVLEQMPIRRPHYKGKIERKMRTVTTVLHGLPGTTFSNIKERGDYDSVGQACITLGDLKQILHIFLLDIYAERFHEGLHGVPARQWERAIENGFLPRVPASSEELLILLGQTTTRKLQPQGIEWEGIFYDGGDLSYLRHELKGEDVKIKYHPGDISRLYLFNPFDKTYITAPARDPLGYTNGLSLWKHKIIKQYQAATGDRTDLIGLGQAKRHIQNIVDAARHRKRLNARKKVARWETSGEPPSLAERSPLANTSLLAPASTLPPATPEIVESQLPIAPLPPLDDDMLTPDQIEKSDEWNIIYQEESTRPS